MFIDDRSLAFGDDASSSLDAHQLLSEPINNSEINYLGPLMGYK